MTISLTIDGRRVEAPDGASVLEAARAEGVEIPTLCHADGVEPFGSCFLCVVEVEGKRGLTPACLCPVEEGMVVRTDTEDIRQARRMAVELLLSDHRGDCEAPCKLACPAGLDIPEFIRRVVEGKPDEALEIILKRIPLPRSLGRVCPRFCERVCRRRELDEPVAICALKRFAADACEPSAPPRLARSGKRVAIVGAGPAGLAAAYELLRLGHECVLFDENDAPGGRLRYAIPEFRLPDRALDQDIEPLQQMGLEFRPRTRLGEDAAQEALRRDFDAVLIATGAQTAEAVDIPGADLATPVLSFLREAGALSGDVVVIGDSEEAVDAARLALRRGAGSAALVCEPPRPRMSCFSEWVDAAEEEGVSLHPAASGVRIIREGEGFRVRGERDGRRFEFRSARVVLAAPRRIDADALAAWGLPVSRRGGAAADPQTLVMSLPGVFAAGEVVRGPSDVVHALASGMTAARSIDQFLRESDIEPPPRRFNCRLGKLDDAERRALAADHPPAPREATRRLPATEARRTLQEADAGFAPEAARAEARRCLQCDCAAKDACKLREYAERFAAQPARFKGEKRAFERDASHPAIVYEPGKCILCGLCVRATRQAGEPLGMTFAERGFAARVRPAFDETVRAALTRAGERCVELCPTGALAFRRGASPESAPA